MIFKYSISKDFSPLKIKKKNYIWKNLTIIVANFSLQGRQKEEKTVWDSFQSK